MLRTIWGDHKRYKDTYFSAYSNCCYFTGDGALRDENGHYRITGRVDDVVIVSGHNLGTAPIEDAINEHQNIAESAIVGFPRDIKGNALYGFVTLKSESSESEIEVINLKLMHLISKKLDQLPNLIKYKLQRAYQKQDLEKS